MIQIQFFRNISDKTQEDYTCIELLEYQLKGQGDKPCGSMQCLLAAFAPRSDKGI